MNQADVQVIQRHLVDESVRMARKGPCTFYIGLAQLLEVQLGAQLDQLIAASILVGLLGLQ